MPTAVDQYQYRLPLFRFGLYVRQHIQYMHEKCGPESDKNSALFIFTIKT